MSSPRKKKKTISCADKIADRPVIERVYKWIYVLSTAAWNTKFSKFTFATGARCHTTRPTTSHRRDTERPYRTTHTRVTFPPRCSHRIWIRTIRTNRSEPIRITHQEECIRRAIIHRRTWCHRPSITPVTHRVIIRRGIIHRDTTHRSRGIHRITRIRTNREWPMDVRSRRRSSSMLGWSCDIFCIVFKVCSCYVMVNLKSVEKCYWGEIFEQLELNPWNKIIFLTA